MFSCDEDTECATPKVTRGFIFKGISLVVRWLRLCLPGHQGWGFSLQLRFHIPLAKTAKRKTKRYCNKFNKDFKNGPHPKKILKKRCWLIMQDVDVGCFKGRREGCLLSNTLVDLIWRSHRSAWVGGILEKCGLGHGPCTEKPGSLLLGSSFPCLRGGYNSHVTALLWEVGGDGEWGQRSVSFPSQRLPLTGGWSQAEALCGFFKVPRAFWWVSDKCQMKGSL